MNKLKPGGTTLYGLYRDVPPDRVWLLVYNFESVLNNV